MPPSRSLGAIIRRLMKRVLGASALSLAFLALTIGTLTLLWHQGALKSWLQARVVNYYVTRVQPKLPFTIEEVDADATWRELLQGRLSKISTVLRWQDLRIRIGGPIDINKPTPQADYYSVKFQAIATLEPALALGRIAEAADRSSAIAIDLSLEAAPDLNRLNQLELFTRSETFSWKPFAIQAKKPHFAFSWKDRQATADFALQSLTWTPSTDRTLNLSDFEFGANTHLRLKPVEIGPEISFQWKSKGAEVLWGSTYLDLPLAILPGEGTIQIEPDSGGEFAFKKLALLAGGRAPGKPAPLQLKASRTASRIDVNWKLLPLPLKELAQGLLAATGGGMGPFTPLTFLNEFELRSGRISSEGSASLHAQKPFSTAPQADGLLRLEDAAFQWRQSKLAAKGIQAEFPFSSRNGMRGIVSAEQIYFRKIRGKLDSTSVSLESRGKDIFANEGLRFRIAGAGMRGASNIPLSVDGAVFQLGPVSGRIGGDAPKGLEILGSLQLEDTPVEPLVRGLCLTEARLPPATVRAQIPYVEIRPGDIDPEGEIHMRLFDGDIRLSEFGMFDLDKEVPEFDFNLDFSGIQLKGLTDWANFGEIIGTLEGSAHDVTFQGPLPTYFDFSIDAKPLKNWIEFSPEALRSIIGTVGGKEAIDEVPIIGDDTPINPFFGALSRRLGGYDVKYAGLSLFGMDGTILLETHDLPDVYRTMKQHFIMWGHRFKMPLQGDTYPVVMDTAGLIRVLRTMVASIQEMSRRNAEKKALEHPENTKPKETPKNDGEIDSSCVPPTV